MRFIMIMGLALALPLMAAAQGYSDAPLLVTTTPDNAPAADATPAANAPALLEPGTLPPNFPAAAVTRLGEQTTGQASSAPPTSPPSPAYPTSPQAPAADQAQAPTPPASPVSPIAKLWPRDTVPIFLQSCTNYHPELIAPCTCVISKLMLAMPHDEFLRLDAAGTIEQDARVTMARQECIGTPNRQE